MRRLQADGRFVFGTPGWSIIDHQELGLLPVLASTGPTPGAFGVVQWGVR